MRAVPVRAVVVSSSSSFALASHFLRRISRITPYPIPFSSPTTSLSSAAAAVSPCYGGRRQTSASLTISSYSAELRRGYSLADLAVARLEWQRDGSGYGGVRRRRFCSVRATEASDSGSVDSPMMQAMEKKTLGFSTNNRSKCLSGIWMGQSFKIKEQLDADVVVVKDAYGDGRHVSIDVVSKAFEGKSAVNRQRMVYKAIWEELESTVHAVDQMVTRTPAEVDSEK